MCQLALAGPVPTIDCRVVGTSYPLALVWNFLEKKYWRCNVNVKVIVAAWGIQACFKGYLFARGNNLVPTLNEMIGCWLL